MTLATRILTHQRRPLLKHMLAAGRPVRCLEVHSGLSGLIGGQARGRGDGDEREFQALWVSSLTCSAIKGIPDMELAAHDQRLATIDEILAVTHKPVIVDGDTGGEFVAFEYLCSRLERLGASAVVIEDKKLPKRNSLSGAADLEDPRVFAEKLRRGCAARRSEDFLIFARLESLIAGRGVADALARARIYLAHGADGILIHSKSASPDEVFAFLDGYAALSRELGVRRPVISVPTTYHRVREEELFERGADVVIYANHLLRASLQAMRRVCASILEHGRATEAQELCASVSELLALVEYDAAMQRDDQSLAGVLDRREE